MFDWENINNSNNDCESWYLLFTRRKRRNNISHKSSYFIWKSILFFHFYYYTNAITKIFHAMVLCLMLQFYIDFDVCDVLGSFDEFHSHISHIHSNCTIFHFFYYIVVNRWNGKNKMREYVYFICGNFLRFFFHFIITNINQSQRSNSAVEQTNGKNF